ncbi:MerR family transcriptional regulator [Gluconacetobacter liquefaciens]|uniref:DNA-binding transcriptional MerR regulator n=1 Tax=Gluconacetobacter liquefaciens TaxID=89584 RepID=A0A370FYF9_GLULI|nr:MerR family transcriptional regulator [Gluconacetobacter liquefaciens]MBB2188186.1 MerR family transcriptional regulator [Gluconacetobacter liquefaciens]RDI34162.1 DNA-binding transcriptional MerR regulator [Gluconacetobacter liquefaciens]
MNTLNAEQGDWPDAGMPEAGEAADPHVLDDAAGAGRLKKAPNAFRTISEVADELHVPQHVLRFWETRFSQVRPLKRGGGRRYYRPDDIELLRRISDLLYVQGYTIKGVQRMLREGGDSGAHAAENPVEVEESELVVPDSPVPVETVDDTVLQEAGPAVTEPELPEPVMVAPASVEPVDGEIVVESVVESVTVMTVEAESPAPVPAISDEETDAAASEIARIHRENLILKDSLRGILVELQALRRLIPV